MAPNQSTAGNCVRLGHAYRGALIGSRTGD
jgi:hypothetical protein